MLREYSATLSMGLWLGLLSLAGGALPVSAQNVFFHQDSKSTNTDKEKANNQYMVYVPGDDAALLQKVRAIAPDAFKGKLDSGKQVVQIGRFNNLNLAQRRVDQLKSAGLQAEVTPVATKIATAASFPISDSFSTPSIANSPTVSIVTSSSLPTTGMASPPPANISSLPGVPGTSDFNQTIEINRKVESGNAPVITTTTVSTSTQNNNVAAATVTTSASVSSQPIRYFVIIPSTYDAVLQRAKNIVPTSKLTTSQRGTYIEVQGYPDRNSAETLSSTLRSQGLDSRVVYF